MKETGDESMERIHAVFTWPFVGKQAEYKLECRDFAVQGMKIRARCHVAPFDPKNPGQFLYFRLSDGRQLVQLGGRAASVTDAWIEGGWRLERLPHVAIMASRGAVSNGTSAASA